MGRDRDPRGDEVACPCVVLGLSVGPRVQRQNAVHRGPKGGCGKDWVQVRIDAAVGDAVSQRPGQFCILFFDEPGHPDKCVGFIRWVGEQSELIRSLDREPVGCSTCCSASTGGSSGSGPTHRCCATNIRRSGGIRARANRPVDVWIQHPTARFLGNDMLVSLRRHAELLLTPLQGTHPRKLE